uniref:Uncharacterized protein n=1 Tax=Brassica oleracea TaxID=3712 RepID=A0A3P6BFG8_BRAOL|nr:unnamed protein product [Brassica oleracea]
MKTSPNRTASSSSLYFALTSRDCNKGVLSIHVFGPEVRSCFSFGGDRCSSFLGGNQTNLKEGEEIMGLTCSYLMKRPESGLELSQQRDQNPYESGVPKSTPF